MRVADSDGSKCQGSGQSPDHKPEWDDHGYRPCLFCGQKVQVFLRRLDWSTVRHLMMADHDRLERATVTGRD